MNGDEIAVKREAVMESGGRFIMTRSSVMESGGRRASSTEIERAPGASSSTASLEAGFR